MTERIATGVAATLVLVVYYLRTIAEVDALIDDFARQSEIAVGAAVVVDNGGHLPSGRHSARLEIIPGDNEFWEFSGWSAGLEHIGPAAGTVVLLNDSFGRNWDIKRPGHRVIRAMLRDARAGKIAGWLDNFSRRERRVNSRIVILPRSHVPALRQSLEAAIAACRHRQNAHSDLFEAPATARLKRWTAAQGGRWDATSATTRMPRIFIEHHLFDAVPAAMLSLRPRTWLGSQWYGITRKFAGERR